MPIPSTRSSTSERTLASRQSASSGPDSDDGQRRVSERVKSGQAETEGAVDDTVAAFTTTPAIKPGAASVGPSISRPVDAHPQLCILRSSLISADLINGMMDSRLHNHIEYRIYNWRRLPSGRVVRGDSAGPASVVWALWVGWMYMTYLLRWTGMRWVGGMMCRLGLFEGQGELKVRREVAMFGYEIDTVRLSILLVAVFSIWLKLITSPILYQSVVPLPNLGIQLTTTRGLSIPFAPSLRNRFTMPLSTSHTFIPLNDISTVILNEGLSRWNVRYYLGIVKTGGRGVEVAFSELCQPVDVLREVYHGVREIMFDEYDESDELDESDDADA